MKLFNEVDKKSLLHLLEQRNDNALISKISELAINLQEDIRIFDEETLLQTALKVNMPKLANWLLDNHCVVNPKHHSCSTTLTSWAIWASTMQNETVSFDIVEKLTQKGALDQLKELKFAEEFIENGFTKLVKSRNYSTIEKLHELGTNFNELCIAVNYDIAGNLIRSGKTEDDKVISELFEKGVITLEKWKKRGLATDSILTLALESGLFKTLVSLLNEVPFVVNSIYLQALASQKDVPKDLLSVFLPKEYINKPVYTSNILAISVRFENETLLSYLLENGAKPPENDDDLLLSDALFTNYSLFKKLIEIGADINYVTSYGYTLLDYIKFDHEFGEQHIEIAKKHGAKTAFELTLNDELSPVISDIIMTVDRGECWSDFFISKLCELEHSVATDWYELIIHCAKNKSAQPSARWLKQTNKIIENIGEVEFSSMMLELLPKIEGQRSNNLALADNSAFMEYIDFHTLITSKSDELINAFSQSNVLVLKGLIWASSFISDIAIASLLRKVAQAMYKKVYGVGMRNAKLANAAVTSLSLLPNEEGISDIVTIYSTTKYNPALKNIQRVVDKIAEDKGVSTEELCQSFITDFGLSDIGKYQKKLGDTIATISCTHVGKCELTWLTGDKSQKTVPSKLKTRFAKDIKELKELAKEIQKATSAHSQRIENSYIRLQNITFKDWKTQYIGDELIGFIARRLIWRLTNTKNQSSDVIFFNGQFIDLHGKTVELDSQSSVTLWHPIMATTDDIIAWQTILAHYQITQPFKQAHREIYLVTEAEKQAKNHSSRYENHVLNQQQFHAIATQRGWKQTRGGGWDGGCETEAVKDINHFQLTVLFDTEGLSQHGITNTGIYSCVGTKRVTFKDQKSHELISLDEVNNIVFSEIMRDIDLFVSVTNVSNDPEWDNDEASYWYQQGFGELSPVAKTRKQVLENIIFMLPNSNLFSVEGRFLNVQGKLAEYKIHLGSSNILIKPHNQYLCIVPKIKQVKLHLPFEGDNKLSVILSKALLLAADNKIKDENILSQINRTLSMLN